MVLFHRQGTVYAPESPKYHPGILIKCNGTAYMNDNLFLKYIELYLIPALGNRPSFFGLDLCFSHTTPAILDTSCSHNIAPSLIAAGCTSLIQSLDVTINKPLKARIQDLTHEAVLDYEPEKWSIGDWRGLTPGV